MPHRSTHPDEEASLSLPSLAFVAVLGFIVYRYFISSRSTSSSSSSRTNGLRFTATQVEQISQMFPQLNRRDIMWDLHRNRGSVAATTERILGGRGLDPAPPSFQPPITFASPSTTSGATGTPKPTKTEIDLITRYNLQSRVAASVKGKERADLPPVASASGSTGGAGGWTSNKESRQETLRSRRDEMILAARRRMLERDEGADNNSGGLVAAS